MQKIREIDPLSHFVGFETYLLSEESEDRARFVNRHRSELAYQTFLELAIHYENLGQTAEALKVLEMAPAHPLVDLWQAYVARDVQSNRLAALEKRTSEFVFPYRRETLHALEWANQQIDHWKLKYYLALNLWGKGRLEDAAPLLEACADQPDDAYLYLGRADLLQKLENKDPLSDFQKANEYRPSDWRTWHALTEYYFDRGQFAEAEKVADKAYQQFPESYVMGMDMARTQVYSGQYEQAGRILDQIQVLPFEGASEGHQLYVWAHTGHALNLMVKKDFKSAIQALEKAKEWPENLGVGQPYNPEERLQDYLLSICYTQTGAIERAEMAHRKVLEQTRNRLGSSSPLHLLGLKLEDRETAYQTAETLAQMTHADTPATQWVLSRFYKEKRLDPQEEEKDRRQPGMILLDRALRW